MKKYSVPKSEAKEIRDAEREQRSEQLSLAGYTGGPLTSEDQIVRLLRAKLDAQRLLKAFDKAAKDYVLEHGPIISDGETWGPVETQREQKCGLSLDEMIDLCMDVGIPSEHIKSLTCALQRRGVGSVKKSSTFRWSK
jgi:hypothetical protein